MAMGSFDVISDEIVCMFVSLVVDVLHRNG
jgi:hypothetical protein